MRFISICVVSLSIGAAYGLVPASRNLIARDTLDPIVPTFNNPTPGQNVSGSSPQKPKEHKDPDESKGKPTESTPTVGDAFQVPPSQFDPTKESGTPKHSTQQSKEQKKQRLQQRIAKDKAKLKADEARLTQLEESGKEGEKSSQENSYQFPQVSNEETGHSKEKLSGGSVPQAEEGLQGVGKEGGSSFNASGLETGIQQPDQKKHKKTGVDEHQGQEESSGEGSKKEEPKPDFGNTVQLDSEQPAASKNITGGTI